MRNKFSEIDTLYEILERFNAMEDRDDGFKQEHVNISKTVKETYSLREWQEISFLEHARILLADASYNHVHRIILENGREVYIVPEEFYNSKANEVHVYKKDEDEEED